MSQIENISKAESPIHQTSVLSTNNLPTDSQMTLSKVITPVENISDTTEATPASTTRVTAASHITKADNMPPNDTDSVPASHRGPLSDKVTSAHSIFDADTDDDDTADFDSDLDSDPQNLGQASDDSDSQFDAIVAMNNVSFTQAKQATNPSQLTREMNKFPNYYFYKKMMASRPDNLTLDQIRAKNWDWKEWCHSYIQWLFPLREPGMNSAQKPLTEDEIKMMKSDPQIIADIKVTLKVMLEFWGFDYDIDLNQAVPLKDELQRKKCFDNFVASHNDLRMTRCMKCLELMDLHAEAFTVLKVLFLISVPNQRNPYDSDDKNDYFYNTHYIYRTFPDFWFPIFEKYPQYAVEIKAMETEMANHRTQRKSQYWAYRF